MITFKYVDLSGDVDSSERAWPLHGLIRAIVTPWEMISRWHFQNSSDREQIRIRSCARHLEIAAYHGSQRFRETGLK